MAPGPNEQVSKSSKLFSFERSQNQHMTLAHRNKYPGPLVELCYTSLAKGHSLPDFPTSNGRAISYFRTFRGVGYRRKLTLTPDE